MEKIIRLECDDTMGWQPIYLTSWCTMPLVFYWSPALYQVLNSVKSIYYWHGTLKCTLSGVRKNEQLERKNQFGIGEGCLFKCARNKRKSTGGDAL